MITARSARRSLTRKARAADLRRQVWAEIARAQAECGPGEMVAVIQTHKAIDWDTGEQRPRRPGWRDELSPEEQEEQEERWRQDQAEAWEWALYCRSAEFGWFLPACLEDAHRRALRLTREGRRTWKWLVRITAQARADFIGQWLDDGSMGPLTRVDSAHPSTGPPVAAGAPEPWHTRRSPRVALAVQSGAVGPMPP